VLCRRQAAGTFFTTEHTDHTEENKQPILPRKNTKLHEKLPIAVDFIAGGNIIHRWRVFWCSVFALRGRLFRLLQCIRSASEVAGDIFTTGNTEEKPSADCRASRNNLLIGLISRHSSSVPP
jgi:hypothetical protein